MCVKADLVQDCDGSTNGGGNGGDDGGEDWMYFKRKSFEGYAGSCSSTISQREDDCITCDAEQVDSRLEIS